MHWFFLIRWFLIRQSSPDADYNRFLENLVNKRRQIADSNPKNLTHFSGNSMSSSATINQSPVNSSQLNSDLRATKSIIIGAGQPIVVPGQQINLGSESKANASKLITATSVNSTLPKVSSETIASIRPALQGEVSQNRPFSNDSKVTSVEEFCPDGGLDKGFLDDLPSVSHSDVRQNDYNCDSDSDSNDTGNPLVAKFHEDPFDDVTMLKNSIPIQVAAPKVNPLAKNKNKSVNAPDLGQILTSKRRNSMSSEDVEIPNILNTKQSNDNSSDGQSNEEFDSWLSDTNQRRSPEGGEDEASLPSIDKTVKDATSNQSTTVDATQIERLQLNDGEEENEIKEKKDKSKKKKKDKKEKKDKKDKSDKEKKRSKSKKSTAEDLLSESKERSSHSERTAEDDFYEAL